MTSRALGLLAAGIAGACALLLGVVASAAGSTSIPGEIPRGVVLASLLGAPAVVGALGAISGRRVLLVAAGILCLCLSVLAFSGVTLILLVPALLFLRASVLDTADRPARQAPNPLRLLALVALAVPVALLAVSRLGIFGLLPLVAFGGLAAGLGRNGALRARPRDALVGFVVVGLVLGATYAAFAFTQTVCWNARQTPTGLVYERIPVTDESGPIGGETGIVASGCSSGEPTIEGTALVGVLLIGAVAISAVAAGTPGRLLRDEARANPRTRA
jgi:hypothetical protein